MNPNAFNSNIKGAKRRNLRETRDAASRSKQLGKDALNEKEQGKPGCRLFPPITHTHTHK